MHQETNGISAFHPQVARESIILITQLFSGGDHLLAGLFINVCGVLECTTYGGSRDRQLLGNIIDGDLFFSFHRNQIYTNRRKRNCQAFWTWQPVKLQSNVPLVKDPRCYRRIQNQTKPKLYILSLNSILNSIFNSMQ